MYMVSCASSGLIRLVCSRLGVNNADFEKKAIIARYCQRAWSQLDIPFSEKHHVCVMNSLGNEEETKSMKISSKKAR